jgi:hypothetical protein
MTEEAEMHTAVHALRDSPSSLRLALFWSWSPSPPARLAREARQDHRARLAGFDSAGDLERRAPTRQPPNLTEKRP